MSDLCHRKSFRCYVELNIGLYINLILLIFSVVLKLLWLKYDFITLKHKLRNRSYTSFFNCMIFTISIFPHLTLTRKWVFCQFCCFLHYLNVLLLFSSAPFLLNCCRLQNKIPNLITSHGNMFSFFGNI